MAQVFNADEVFDIGVQIEKNGRAFYLAAKDRTQDPLLKNMFAELAVWEGNHVELFEHLRTTLPADANRHIEFDPDNMIHLYLKAVADSILFVNQNRYTVDSCHSSLELLQKALDFERDAVVLYSSMKEVVPLNLGKNEIDKLIAEELNHVGQLTKEISKLQSDN